MRSFIMKKRKRFEDICEVDDTDPDLAEDVNEEVEVAEKLDLDSLFVNFDLKRRKKLQNNARLVMTLV